MVTASITVKQVARAISEMEKDNDFDVVLAYTNDIKPVPVTKPIVAVSLKKCDIGDKKIIIDESGEENETQWRNITTVVSVDIYLPYAYKQVLGVQLFDEIAHVLFNTESFVISEATCEDAHYDRSSQTILVPSHFALIETKVP